DQVVVSKDGTPGRHSRTGGKRQHRGIGARGRMEPRPDRFGGSVRLATAFKCGAVTEANQLPGWDVIGDLQILFVSGHDNWPSKLLCYCHCLLGAASRIARDQNATKTQYRQRSRDPLRRVRCPDKRVVALSQSCLPQRLSATISDFCYMSVFQLANARPENVSKR